MGVGVHQGSVLSPLLFILVFKHCRISSSLVCHGSFSMLMTWCSSQTPRRSVSPSSRHGRLAWKVKGSVLTWRKPSSWCPLLTWMSYRNQASIPVLSAARVSATTPLSACSASCGPQEVQRHHWSTGECPELHPRCKGNSRPIDGRPMTQVDVEGTKLDVEDALCYLGDMLSSGGGYDSAIASRCCVAWGKFTKLLPHLQAPLS